MINKNSREDKLQAFGQLLDVIDTLREQCPWDSVQTNQSMRPNTIEEAMELAEALLGDNNDTIKKELGDVLLHVLLYARIGEETGAYDIATVCDALRHKLIYRHPHIYAGDKVDGVKELLQHWEVIKMKEKGGNKTVLGGVPKTLPSLIKAERVQEKAANVGFDWDKKEDVWAKVKEEISEVEAELKAGDEVNIENFSRYLSKFDNIQFALITHQKATMEHADVLYGVTMPEQGISRMLSLKLGDEFDVEGLE